MHRHIGRVNVLSVRHCDHDVPPALPHPAQTLFHVRSHYAGVPRHVLGATCIGPWQCNCGYGMTHNTIVGLTITEQRTGHIKNGSWKRVCSVREWAQSRLPELLYVCPHLYELEGLGY